MHLSRSVLLLLPLCAGCASLARPPSSPPRYMVSMAEAPAYQVAQGKGVAHLLLNAQTGATAASLGVLELHGDAQVPEHVHESSVEILYIEQGNAEMTVEGRTVLVGAGDAVYIPAGTRHSARVLAGGAAFRAVQVYVGPGPEQRFRQGPPVTSAQP